MMKRPILMGALLLATACAGLQKASPWMMDRLKAHAAFDMQCTEARLTAVETGSFTYGVRGCDKQAIYLMQACNRLTETCTFTRNGEIRPVDAAATSSASATR